MKEGTTDDREQKAPKSWLHKFVSYLLLPGTIAAIATWALTSAFPGVWDWLHRADTECKEEKTRLATDLSDLFASTGTDSAAETEALIRKVRHMKGTVDCPAARAIADRSLGDLEKELKAYQEAQKAAADAQRRVNEPGATSDARLRAAAALREADTARLAAKAAANKAERTLRVGSP